MNKLILILNLMILSGCGIHYLYHYHSIPVKTTKLPKNGDIVIIKQTNNSCPLTCPLRNIILHPKIGIIYPKNGVI